MKASTVLAVFATALLSNATPTPEGNGADANDGGPLSYGGGVPPPPQPVQSYGPPQGSYGVPPSPVPFPPPGPASFPPPPGPFPFPPPGGCAGPDPCPGVSIPGPGTTASTGSGGAGGGGNNNPCGNNQVASCCNGNAGSGGLLGPILGGNCGILGQHPCSQGGSACCTTTQSGLINLALPCKLFDSLL
ncbi:hypothetical protein AC578_4401 [Pseudocercospora eumusae]|uniref:Hydrophobin n=1 Tax=Pseudocercospora eumusae TaxID=321146 RepID=A0A139H2M3_9PEZI|nr:hypothetical protein AC578_4401 [Pseudocercospora eumusae]